MRMHWNALPIAVALTMGGVTAAAAVDADGADCLGHFSSEGNFLTGRKFSTWINFTTVSKADLYARVYNNIAKDGWNITGADKDAGILSANQSVSYGKGAVAPLTIAIESLGTGSKATATFRVGGGQVTKEDTVKHKMCAYFG